MSARFWPFTWLALSWLGVSLLHSPVAAVGNAQAGQTQIDRIQRQQGGTLWWPPDTPGPRTSPSTGQTAPGQATLDLTIMVRLLRDQVKQGKSTLDPEARQAVRQLLLTLSQQRTLGSQKAASLQTSLLENLPPADAALLQRQRATLERFAQNLLSRARIATPDGPVDQVEFQYGFMVPGGSSIVRQIRSQPTLNPYWLTGANASVLTELLAVLSR